MMLEIYKKLLKMGVIAALCAPLVAAAVQISVPSATSYGQVLIGQSSGNYTPTATSSTNFFTVTTSGTSGAATYSGGTLNIPQYSGASGITDLGTGFATSTGPKVSLSTTTQTFNGLTIAQMITRPNGTNLLFTPLITGTLDNTGLTNSTIGATSPNSTLTFGSAAALGSTFTGDLNLAHSNIWTAKQTFNAQTDMLGPLVIGTSTASTTIWGATATSTFASGISLTNGGCFAIAGACLTAGSIGGGSTEAVNWATTAVLAGTPGYLNGTAGVGATLIEVGTGALSVDGNSPAMGDRVLVKNQASALQNGVYVVTATGSGIASYTLTRASDYNTPTEITPGITTYVLSGTANTDTTWAVSYTPPLTIGTNSLNYSESAGQGGTVTSVAASVPGFLSISGSPVTTSGTLAISYSGTALPIANGGTGQTTFTSSQLLYGNGTNALSSVGTTSLGVTGPITFSGTLGAQVGGVGGTFGCATCVLTTRNINTTFPLQGGSTLAGDLTLTSAFSTTSNSGMSQGNLYVGTGGVFQTAASSSIFGYTPLNPTRALTISGTANQISSSAGSQDLSADRTWTLSLPNHVIFPAGGYEAAIGTTTNATSTSFAVTNAVSALLLTNSNGSVGKYGGAGACSANNFVTTLSAIGGTTCGTASITINSASVALGGSITVASTTLLGDINTWTKLQSFALASSTQFSAGTNTFYVDSNGHITAKDTVNAWSGVTGPTNRFVLSTGTTTQWLASTTGSRYSPTLPIDFAGTLRMVTCTTDSATSFLGINIKVNGSSISPSYFVASSTAGKIIFTSGNTFTAGQKILMDVGTTTNDGTITTAGVDCTFDVTETP